MVLLYILASVVLVSLVSFVGIFTLSLKKNFVHRTLLFFVSFAAGALIGDAFLHLLPEIFEKGIEPLTFSVYALIGILIFFVIEKFLHWQHRHVFQQQQHVGHQHTLTKPYVWMNLIGDAVHNFIDGAIIAGSYLASVPVGISTTIAVILHEAPQELGDFAVLIKGGFSRKKALFFNFLSALTAVVGGVLTYAIGTKISSAIIFLIPFTFSSFLYIALAGLIPELHHEDRPRQLILQAFGVLFGILVMAGLLMIE